MDIDANSLYFCCVKFLAIFISLNIFITGVSWCNGNASIDSEVSYIVEIGNSEKSIPSCCKSNGEDENGPMDSEPCQDGCSCYCCSVVVAASVRHTATVILQDNVRPQSWQVSQYVHDFTHMIWQPPQFF